MRSYARVPDRESVTRMVAVRPHPFAPSHRYVVKFEDDDGGLEVSASLGVEDALTVHLAVGAWLAEVSKSFPDVGPDAVMDARPHPDGTGFVISTTHSDTTVAVALDVTQSRHLRDSLTAWLHRADRSRPEARRGWWR